MLHATASKDGTKATLFTIASKKVSPALRQGDQRIIYSWRWTRGPKGF